MAAGRFSRLRGSRPTPILARSDYTITPETPAPAVAAQRSNTRASISAPIVAISPRCHPNPSTYPSVLTEGRATGLYSPQGDADIPVPAHTGEIESPPPWPVFCLDPQGEAEERVGKRYRILVMGRRNAGKTTILQRVRDAMGQPEIYNGTGEKVDPAVMQGSLGRGYHNIEDELVFGSNSGFIFHDSCGFEAGGIEQFDRVKEFVINRAVITKLDERINAIWFCIPLTDSHRMITAAETKFFNECDTGGVPVILLATKADTLELEAIQELENQDLSADDEVQVTELHGEMLNRHLARLTDWLQKTKFPPHDYLLLSGMETEGADCTALLTCTANALGVDAWQLHLVSKQQSTLEQCMEFAVMKMLKECINMQDNKTGLTSPALILPKWFPYKFDFESDQGDFELFLFLLGLKLEIAGVCGVTAGGGGCTLTTWTATLLDLGL